jgi:hypothetical protein
MKRVRTRKPTIRRDRSRLEILPADPRDPDVVRAKTLTHTRPSCGLLARSPEGGVPEVFLPDNGLFHLEGDLP